MLHLAGRIAFGVDVADLLELEGPLHGDRIVDAPAQEDHILGFREQVGQLGTALVVVLHQALQQVRHGPQAIGQGMQFGGTAQRRFGTTGGSGGGGLSSGKRGDGQAATFRKGKRQAIEGQELAQEGLGGRHPHLDAGADIEQVGHQATQGALGTIGDPQQSGCEGKTAVGLPALLLHRQGRQGVGRLPRLGHADREGVGGQRRRRIAEFTGVIHAGGDAGELLEQVGPHLGGMAAGAAGQDLDPLHALVDRVVEGERHQGLGGQMAGHPEGGRFRLLMDLLEHEVAEAALVRHVLGAAQQARGALHPLARRVVELDPEGGEQGHLAVLHRQDGAGEARQSGRVAGAEELAFPQSDQQRGLAPRHHQGPRHRRPHHRQGISPVQPRQHLLHRLQQQGGRGRTPGGLQVGQAPGHQVGDHLGVGVGEEHHTAGLQLLPQAAVVLDDAVLHHRQPAAAIEVGVGVALLGLAVGGPAGVADAAQPRCPTLLIAGGEVHQLALGLEAVEAAAGGIRCHGGDAGGVIAAIFELPQSIEQLGCRLARTDQGNDAAHSWGARDGGRRRARQLSLWADGPGFAPGSGGQQTAAASKKARRGAWRGGRWEAGARAGWTGSIHCQTTAIAQTTAMASRHGWLANIFG